jgi:uncharacterized protein (DUF1778 family)
MKTNRKSEVVLFRVTGEEKALLQQKADGASLSLSKFLLQEGVRRRMRSPAAQAILDDLRILTAEHKAFADSFDKSDSAHQDYLARTIAVVERIHTLLDSVPVPPSRKRA